MNEAGKYKLLLTVGAGLVGSAIGASIGGFRGRKKYEHVSVVHTKANGDATVHRAVLVPIRHMKPMKRSSMKRIPSGQKKRR